MAASRVRLWKCQKQVLQDLRADDVIIYLRQDDVINEAEQETLLHEITTRGRAEKLLGLLFHKMRDECGGFVYTSFRSRTNSHHFVFKSLARSVLHLVGDAMEPLS